MSVIEVNFRGSKFSLSCDNVEKTQTIAKELNDKAAEIAAVYKGGITDLRALFLTAMIMQDEITTLRKQLESSLEHGQSSSVDKQNMAISLDKVSQYINGLTELVESNVGKLL